ncbi:MAG TPA: hypothetical protein VL860_14250, partial [Planctomycetota bacterium]|nr:hypothetical protein [Planctomycetota bacterium]
MHFQYFRLGLSRFGVVLLALLLGAASLFALSPQKKKRKPVLKGIALSIPRSATAKRKPILRGPWRVPTYADSTEGDRIDGEDLTERRAAVSALAGLNGTI